MHREIKDKRLSCLIILRFALFANSKARNMVCIMLLIEIEGWRELPVR